MAGDPVGRAQHRAVALARACHRPASGETSTASPSFTSPAIPIGARATAAFLRRVARRRRRRSGAGGSASSGREERTYYHYLRDFAQFYAGCTSQYRLPSEINIVGESAYALAIAKFFVGDLGLNPGVFVAHREPARKRARDDRAPRSAISRPASTASRCSSPTAIAPTN